MTTQSQNQALLAEHRFLWQPVREYLENSQYPAAVIADIERLAVASPYALGQLQRHPEWVDMLVTLDAFQLDPQIIDCAPEQKIDLEQVKQTLRHYRHRKQVEIIYSDVVNAKPIEATLRHQIDLSQQFI